jgi:hypothetical protein
MVLYNMKEAEQQVLLVSRNLKSYTCHSAFVGSRPRHVAALLVAVR